MQFLIHTTDFNLADDIKNSAPKGVSVVVHQRMTRSIDSPDAVVIVLEFIRDAAKTIELSLIARWLYEKTKEKDCHIQHRSGKVVKEEAFIRRLIEDDLEIGKND